MREQANGGDDVGREAFGRELLEGDVRVLHGVVQERDSLRALAGAAHHDTQRVKDIGGAVPVLLARMGGDGDLKGALERSHWKEKGLRWSCASVLLVFRVPFSVFRFW